MITPSRVGYARGPRHEGEDDGVWAWETGAAKTLGNRPPSRPLMVERSINEDHLMTDLTAIKEHMDVIGADGVHVGTVDKVDADRIKLAKADGGAHGGHHHYISTGLVADIEGDKIRLSATAANALLFEEEKGGEATADK